MKILPELLKSVEFGGGGPKALTAVVKIGTKLTDDEYSSRLTPVIVRLFANPDRAIRVSLLDNLPLMIDRLPQKLVTDKIFPQMVSTVTYMSLIENAHVSRLPDSPMLRPLFESKPSRQS
jgi:SCY1-like protein 1